MQPVKPSPEESDEVLLALYSRWRETSEEISRDLHMLEEELLRRMHERRANGIPSDVYLCEMVTDVSYDRTRFTQLKEISRGKTWPLAGRLRHRCSRWCLSLGTRPRSRRRLKSTGLTP